MMTLSREHAALSWRLIEWKVAYYRPEYVHPTRMASVTVSDEQYDEAELRYLALCRELGQPNTVVHKAYPGYEDLVQEWSMMEIDEARPSVQLVLRKLSTPLRKPRTPRRG
jgi:hypothetical protein